MRPSVEAEWELRRKDREPMELNLPPEPWTMADIGDFCVAVSIAAALIIALAL